VAWGRGGGDTDFPCAAAFALDEGAVAVAVEDDVDAAIVG